MNRPANRNLSSKSLVTSFFELILCKILFYLRRMSKYLMHLVTGKSELERICTNEENISDRVKKIEKSLSKSSNEVLKQLSTKLANYSNNQDEIVATIMKIKNISSHSLKFRNLMKDAISKMMAYQNLVAQVERLRTQTFSCDNRNHDEMLMNIWKGLKGEKDRLESRITKRWSEIGFQGSNPATDFRGMGMLALEGLNFLINDYNQVALSLYSKSLHPKHGYPFAIVAINIISWTHSFLVDGHLKTHLYSQSSTRANNINLKNFFKIFVCLFVEFNDYWFLKEPNVMQFEQISKEFNVQVRRWVNTPSNLQIKEHQLDKLNSE